MDLAERIGSDQFIYGMAGGDGIVARVDSGLRCAGANGSGSVSTSGTSTCSTFTAGRPSCELTAAEGFSL